MIELLNDLAALAARHGSTEYHARRMFSSLAGMPFSEYVRRRRMPLAAAEVPEDLDAIELPAGSWALFRTEGEHPAALQEAYAASATEWFPSTAWRLREGPSIVSIVEHNADFTRATCELWFPIERG